MIDDYAQVQELMRKMEAQLPIPARPTSAFVRGMREQGISMTPNQELTIKSLVYLGDEGGIMCDVTLPGSDTVTLTSLTHIRIKSSHPLAEEIRAYQMARTRKLAQGGFRTPASFTIEPPKRRRR
jgi:hypothetical protein